VPRHGGAIEPLAALYERRAILREGFELRCGRSHSMHVFVSRIAARFVAFDAATFHNVNLPEDLS
jgi:molybdopterin-guanine dinucleotide biosynthesis protein A